MKKLLKISALFLLVSLMLCAVSFSAFAESDTAAEPDKSDEIVSSDMSADDAPVLTIGADEPVTDDESADTSESAVLTTGETDDATEDAEAESETEPIQFVLIKKFQKLDKKEWTMFFILLGVFFAAVLVQCLIYGSRNKNNAPSVESSRSKVSITKILVVGAISISLSFVLSYVKLFSMPYGGSVTLASMLPLMVYAAWVGPKYGFLAAFAYGLLQLIQGTYAGIHWASILLDYVLAFSALGLTSLFKHEKLLPNGILIAGFARMCISIISGYLLFAEYAPEGMNPLLYTVLYNLLTIGVDTIICMIVYIIPPVRKAFNKMKVASGFGTAE